MGEVQGPSCSSFVPGWKDADQVALSSSGPLPTARAPRALLCGWRAPKPFLPLRPEDIVLRPHKCCSLSVSLHAASDFDPAVTAEQNHCSLVKKLENLNCRMEKAPWDKRQTTKTGYSVELTGGSEFPVCYDEIELLEVWSYTMLKLARNSTVLELRG